jgi:hypothetical protein
MNYAVNFGHLKIIRSIEQKSVLINPEFVKNLHMAVRNEDVNCVKELLEDQDLGVQEKKIPLMKGRKLRKHISEFL